LTFYWYYGIVFSHFPRQASFLSVYRINDSTRQGQAEHLNFTTLIRGVFVCPFSPAVLI